MRKKKKVAISIVGGAVLLALLGLVFVPKIQDSMEQASVERWMLENIEIYESEFAPTEIVDAVRAEYMTEEEASKQGLSLAERGSYNQRKTDASERLIEWTRENHHSGLNVNDENIMVYIARSSDRIDVHIETKIANWESPENHVMYEYLYSEFQNGKKKYLFYFRRPHIGYSMSNTNGEFVYVERTRVDLPVYREYMKATEHKSSSRSFQGLLDYNKRRNEE